MIKDAETPLNEPEPEGTENASDSAAAGPESDDESIAAGATDSTSGDDSITFSRCASCRHAEELDRVAGTPGGGADERFVPGLRGVDGPAAG